MREPLGPPLSHEEVADNLGMNPPCPSCGGPKWKPLTNKCLNCNQEQFPNPYVFVDGEWVRFNEW